MPGAESPRRGPAQPVGPATSNSSFVSPRSCVVSAGFGVGHLMEDPTLPVKNTAWRVILERSRGLRLSLLSLHALLPLLLTLLVLLPLRALLLSLRRLLTLGVLLLPLLPLLSLLLSLLRRL